MDVIRDDTSTSYLQFDLNLDNASALAALACSKFRLGLELLVINALNCNPLVPSDGGGVIDDAVKSSGLWHAVTDVPVEFKNQFYQLSSAHHSQYAARRVQARSGPRNEATTSRRSTQPPIVHEYSTSRLVSIRTIATRYRNSFDFDKRAVRSE